METHLDDDSQSPYITTLESSQSPHLATLDTPQSPNVATLHPPSSDLPVSTSRPSSNVHSRNSSSTASTSNPSHGSDIYISSYYYGNQELPPDLALGASTSTLPSWVIASRTGTPTGSPRFSSSNDQSLLHRLSWGSRQHTLSPSHLSDLPRISHSHQISSSSADAGLIRGPLDSIFQDVSDATLDHGFDQPRTSIESQAPVMSTIFTDPIQPLQTRESDHHLSESDHAILTSHQSQPALGSPINVSSDLDAFPSPDQLDGVESQLHFKSTSDIYATAGLSPNSRSIQRARSSLQRMSKSIKRISQRVVQLDTNHAYHEPLAEQDADDSDTSAEQPTTRTTAASQSNLAFAVEDLQLIRGKSLGIWGPNSRIRRSLSNLLSQWWIEPAVLVLIVANAVVLVVQSAKSVFDQPRKPSYFGSVENTILFAIFCIYTLEVVARIIVSGLVINPPPIYVTSTQPDPDPDNSDTLLYQQLQRDHKRKMSQSNTLDTFAMFGDRVRNRAQKAMGGPPSSYTAAPTNGFAGDLVSQPMSRDPTYKSTSTTDETPALLSERRLQRSETAIAFSSSNQPGFWQDHQAPFLEAIRAQRVQAVHHAFLRHSWNRVDFLAIVSFWIMFILALTKQETTNQHHIYVFRAFSVLRCARLMTITSGTTTILQSLKSAAPILLEVTFLTTFAMLLLGIIGIQSFQGSYRRSCVWVGDINNQPGQNYTLSQICGGYINATDHKVGHLLPDGSPSGFVPKGFICPKGQVCLEASQNPQGNTQSFDNIFESLLQVIIVISCNGWSDTMYNMIDADYFVSCLYFIVGIIILNFWLANLFVAVITNSFATLTAKTKKSAFADQKLQVEPKPEHDNRARRRIQLVANVYKRFWGFTKYVWLIAIVADVGFQASRATYMPRNELKKREQAELGFTIAFAIEILMRFISFVLDGDSRSFLRSNSNVADLFLAVVTCIIQIPPIKNSAVYPWLTVFQLARFYRVTAAVPRMKALLARVFGSMMGLLNMVLFLLMMVGLASLIALQLFRGDIPQQSNGQPVEMNFKSTFNSFLAMYQIFSSENWTDVLYAVLPAEVQFKQAVIGGIYLCGWFLFANFIVLQMFIAVINENFRVAEGEKRQQQLEHYLRRNKPLPPSFNTRLVDKLNPYRYLKNRTSIKPNPSGDQRRPNPIIGASHETRVHVDEKEKRRKSIQDLINNSSARGQKTFVTLKKMFRLDQPEQPVPLESVRARHLRQSLTGDHLFLPGGQRPDNADQVAKLFADERKLVRMRTDLGLPVEPNARGGRFRGSYDSINDDYRRQQAEFIASHPSYDKAYFIFSNHNKFRRFCQSLVPCSYRERMFGRPVSPSRHTIFQIIILCGIAGSVVSAAIATPAYRRDYYLKHGLIRASWFSVLEISLSTLFLTEFAIKTIADGFAFTHNAYVLSIWNAIDLIVLITLLINVSAELAVIGGVSRFTRALKAFRPLRLVNLSSFMRETFHAVMIAGAGRIVDASILSILYIIPYAVWGQNLFAGLLYSCNDGSPAILGKFNCSGEYSSSPSSWNFLAPRVWANPTQGSDYSFDDFSSSILILFEIISLEGWINVMSTAMSVAGENQQLQTDSQQVNALFFVIYNLVGSTTVLTLFVSVIIENFETFSGAAYQTAEQRRWIDLKRLIMRQRPSKRPKVKPTSSIRAWCYARAVDKHGWWSRAMTMLYVANIIVLMTQQFTDPFWVDRLRDAIYLGFTVIYCIDILVRLYGLGWINFKENPWNLYDLFVVSGTFATTLPLLHDTLLSRSQVDVQFQKIFLTCVAFKVVQKNNALNQLFKISVASLPAILSLFVLWLTMFLIWGIMLVEVFGLTRWGPNETYSKNFSTFIGALVFLCMMSTGEGWNQYMHDYTVSSPQCTPSSNYLDTDCGSTAWALGLFISWNIISMYIFLNMFTGTVVENFSYIFDLGGKISLSREQVRDYKEAWSKYDIQRSGYMQKEQLIPFLQSLTGVLKVSLYPPECSVKVLKEALETGTPLASPLSRFPSPKGALDRLKSSSPLKSPLRENKRGDKAHFMFPQSPSANLAPNETTEAMRLNRAMAEVDCNDLRIRKIRFNRLYHETLLKMEPGKGISFNKMLTLLAQYTLINAEEALDVQELIKRRVTLEKVDDRINLERVRGVLKMVYLRRKFLALRIQQKRDETFRVVSGQPLVPTIVVDGTLAGPTRGERPELPHLDLSNVQSSDSNDKLGQSLVGSVPTLSLSPQRSLRELEERASPIIESFESTAWGGVMSRVSRSDDTPYPSEDLDHRTRNRRVSGWRDTWTFSNSQGEGKR